MQTVLIIDDEKDLCRILMMALRKEKFFVDCPFCVIMICADASPETRKDAFREGVRVFLQKSFPVGSVKEAIYGLA